MAYNWGPGSGVIRPYVRLELLLAAKFLSGHQLDQQTPGAYFRRAWGISSPDFEDARFPGLAVPPRTVLVRWFIPAPVGRWRTELTAAKSIITSESNGNAPPIKLHHSAQGALKGLTFAALTSVVRRTGPLAATERPVPFDSGRVQSPGSVSEFRVPSLRRTQRGALRMSLRMSHTCPNK